MEALSAKAIAAELRGLKRLLADMSK
jgi:hypothetical protein